MIICHIGYISSGVQVVSSGSEQLYEAAWRPGRLSELDVSPEEVAKGMAATVEGGKKQAYKPPKARRGYVDMSYRLSISLIIVYMYC